MVMISMVAHVMMLTVFAFFSGFTTPMRISPVPSYTSVTVVSAGQLAGTPAKEVRLKKATKQITTKKPTLIQEKASLSKLEASKMNVEKKALVPEKVAAKQKESGSSDSGAKEPRAASEQQSAAATAGGTHSRDSFAVQGIGSGTAGTDIPEIAVYTSIVVDRIMEAWFLPPSLKREALKRNLIMVVDIRIDQNGRVSLQGVERTSGNSLFDNYALSAIKKVQAESFPPLPDVYRRPYLDLGIRFHPSEVGS